MTPHVSLLLPLDGAEAVARACRTVLNAGCIDNAEWVQLSFALGMIQREASKARVSEQTGNEAQFMLDRLLDSVEAMDAAERAVSDRGPDANELLGSAPFDTPIGESAP